MPEPTDGGKPGADASAQKGGNTGDAAPDKNAGKPVDNSNDDDAGGDKPKGRFVTDDEINDIVKRRLARATKDAEDKAQLSKEQLLERERDEAVKDLRVSNARDEFITASGIDYAKASRLFKVYKDELEFDDKGKVENLKDVLKSARADWPEWFGNEKPKGGADLGGGNGDSGKKPNEGMNAIFRRGRQQSS